MLVAADFGNCCLLSDFSELPIFCKTYSLLCVATDVCTWLAWQSANDCIRNSKSPSLYQEDLRAFGALLQYIARKLTTLPYPSLPTIQTLKFSQRWELRVFSGLSWTYAVLGMRTGLYLHIALDSQEYVWAFQSPYGHLLPQLFLLSLLVNVHCFSALHHFSLPKVS